MPLTHREPTDPCSQAATAIMKAPPAVLISSSFQKKKKKTTQLWLLMSQSKM